MSRPPLTHLMLASLAGLALGLSACKVGPNYSPPKPAAPEAFTHTGAEGFVTGSLANPEKAVNAEWWKLLGDSALDDLIRRAAEGNLDVRLAAARVREARAQRGVVAADAYPQVDVSGEASR